MTLRRLASSLLALFLAACSIELGPDSTGPTAVVPVIAATSLPSGSPTPSGAPAWTNLDLSGQLLYTLGAQGLQALDLATGVVRTVFLPPEGAWLTAASAAPDGRQLALAYAPPPPAGEAQLGYTSLYLLAGECIARPEGCAPNDLQLLVTPSQPHEAYFSPVWAPDGQSLYLAHFTPSDADTGDTFHYSIERIALPDGAPQMIAADALWPAVSPDGQRIAYVFSDPKDFSNHLFVAAADGSRPQPMLEPTTFSAVDAPVFTPDGQHLAFSAVGEGPQSAVRRKPAGVGLNWLLGARPAEAAPDAHNVPSDWWWLPVAGGAPERLSRVYDTGLFGAFGPDGRYLAYISLSGLHLLDVGTGTIVPLLNTRGGGTVTWVP